MALIGITGGAQAFSGANGGKVHAFNNMSTTPQVVAAANPSRTAITFHNPHASINMYVAPSTDYAGTTLSPTTSALGGCFAVFAGNTLTLTGEVQVAWQGFSASSSGLPFTVMESNL